ncbi:hypothetical protein BKA70DRAFT_1565349 [Coprinopsis sp. MPI-PUGE-AT-0042]|nr:hypothetical protein BKA70DRAFT_1565349 [Coprinopsis sp. MPI-PUGE-AT-0042]
MSYSPSHPVHSGIISGRFCSYRLSLLPKQIAGLANWPQHKPSSDHPNSSLTDARFPRLCIGISSLAPIRWPSKLNWPITCEAALPQHRSNPRRLMHPLPHPESHLRRRDPQTDEPRRRPLSPQHTFHQYTHGPTKEKPAYIKPVYPFSSPPPIPTHCVTTAMALPPTTPNGSSENFTVEAHLHPRLGCENPAFNFVKPGRSRLRMTQDPHSRLYPLPKTPADGLGIWCTSTPESIDMMLVAEPQLSPRSAPETAPSPFNYDSTPCNEGTKLDKRNLALVHVHHSLLTASLS